MTYQNDKSKSLLYYFIFYSHDVMWQKDIGIGRERRGNRQIAKGNMPIATSAKRCGVLLAV